MLTGIFFERGVEKIYQTVENVSSIKTERNTACCVFTSVQAEGFVRSVSVIIYKSVENCLRNKCTLSACATRIARACRQHGEKRQLVCVRPSFAFVGMVFARALSRASGARRCARDFFIVGESLGVHPGGEGHSGDSPAFSSSVWLLEWKRRRPSAGPGERQAEKRAGPATVLPAFGRKGQRLSSDSRTPRRL